MLKVDCHDYSKLPNITFKLKNQDIVLTPEEYMIQGKMGHCAPSLMVLDVPEPRGPLFVFGDIVLRKYFFDLDFIPFLTEIKTE